MIRERFVHMAVELAKTSACRMKHGALITKGNRVLGQGTNVGKTHPDWYLNQHWSYHAEITALKNGNGQVRGSTVYSFRNEIWKVSRPCAGCFSRMRRLGVRSVVYIARTTGPAGPIELVEERL